MIHTNITLITNNNNTNWKNKSKKLTLIKSDLQNLRNKIDLREK